MGGNVLRIVRNSSAAGDAAKTCLISCPSWVGMSPAAGPRFPILCVHRSACVWRSSFTETETALHVSCTPETPGREVWQTGGGGRKGAGTARCPMALSHMASAHSPHWPLLASLWKGNLPGEVGGWCPWTLHTRFPFIFCLRGWVTKSSPHSGRAAAGLLGSQSESSCEMDRCNSLWLG